MIGCFQLFYRLFGRGKLRTVLVTLLDRHGIDRAIQSVHPAMLYLVGGDDRLQHCLNNRLVAMFVHHRENGSAAWIFDFNSSFDYSGRRHPIRAHAHTGHDFRAQQGSSTFSHVETLDHLDLRAHDILAAFR
jgi:hypothetical protein